MKMYVYIYIYIYVHICVHTYTNRYLHTCIHPCISTFWFRGLRYFALQRYQDDMARLTASRSCEHSLRDSYGRVGLPYRTHTTLGPYGSSMPTSKLPT